MIKIQNSKFKIQNLEIRFKSFKFLIVIFIFYFFIFNFTYAQYGFTDFLGNVPGQQLGIQWLFNLLNRLTCYFYQFAIIVFGVMLVIYGLMFFKSRGSPQGMTEARKALTWGLVGGFIIFAVFTIIMSVASFIGADFVLLRMITCQ